MDTIETLTQEFAAKLREAIRREHALKAMPEEGRRVRCWVPSAGNLGMVWRGIAHPTDYGFSLVDEPTGTLGGFASSWFESGAWRWAYENADADAKPGPGVVVAVPTSKLLAARKLQGQYLGALRSLTGAARARVKAVTAARGVKAGLAAARKERA